MELGHTIWLFNIAMENPVNKWRFIAGKIIYKWVIYTMAMLVISRWYVKLQRQFDPLPMILWSSHRSFSIPAPTSRNPIRPHEISIKSQQNLPLSLAKSHEIPIIFPVNSPKKSNQCFFPHKKHFPSTAPRPPMVLASLQSVPTWMWAPQQLGTVQVSARNHGKT